jgi:hypothetical protein
MTWKNNLKEIRYKDAWKTKVGPKWRLGLITNKQGN